MAQKILGIEITGKNIVIALAFMIVTYIAIRVVATFAILLTSGIIGVIVSVVVGYLLFAAYMRGR